MKYDFRSSGKLHFPTNLIQLHNVLIKLISHKILQLLGSKNFPIIITHPYNCSEYINNPTLDIYIVLFWYRDSRRGYSY